MRSISARGSEMLPTEDIMVAWLSKGKMALKKGRKWIGSSEGENLQVRCQGGGQCRASHVIVVQDTCAPPWARLPKSEAIPNGGGAARDRAGDSLAFLL